MIITIHQPSYWPWLGLLDKIAKAEKFIILDNIEINKASYQFRNIFFCNGEAKFISLPINYKKNTKINDVTFKNNNWAFDHLNKLTNYYRKAPFYKEVFPLIENLYLTKNEVSPSLFVVETILFLMKQLQIKTITELSSEKNYTGQKGDLVFNICKENNTDTYISGQGAKEYMTETNFNKFRENNINIKWQKFEHPIYQQQKNKPFVSGLAGLDLLFFLGFEQAKLVFQNNLIK